MSDLYIPATVKLFQTASRSWRFSLAINAVSGNEITAKGVGKAAQKMNNLENAIKDYCIEKTLEIYGY